MYTIGSLYSADVRKLINTYELVCMIDIQIIIIIL